MAFDRRSSYEAADAVAAIYADLGHAYVEPGGDPGRPLEILDEARATILDAWALTLIPGDERWPSAADVGIADYVDRTLALAIGARAPILRIIDDAQAAAHGRHDADFVDLTPEHRANVLTSTELLSPLVFTVLKELTYEAYYRHPAVIEALRSNTGFRSELPVNGTELEANDDALLLLADVAERPSIVREVEP
jgi:hypothetical protein